MGRASWPTRIGRVVASPSSHRPRRIPAPAFIRPRPISWSGLRLRGSLGLALVITANSLVSADVASRPVLVTNEYGHWHAIDPLAVQSPIWDMTSGSLFVRDGVWWTGRPDDLSPDPRSEAGTGSAVFRLTTREQGFGNVRVAVRLRIDAFVTSPGTPAEDWDGVHIFLRYQSQYQLYYASINRRDGTTAIKKKEPGGPSNGGTYYTLATGVAAVPIGEWQPVAAAVETLPSGGVRVSLYRGLDLLLETVDDGRLGGPPITNPGAVGIRGDNCEFEFRDFRVADLDSRIVRLHPNP
jgi:hypothetical protein